MTQVTEETVSQLLTADSDEQLDLARFTLSTPVSVAHHLKSIVNAGQMLTVFSNHGKTFILTRLLEVDQRNGTLVFDWGGDAEANRQLLASDRQIFVCAPEGVKTQFSTGRVREVNFDGRPAFEVALPPEVIKLQRREFFRVPTRVSAPIECQIADHAAGPVVLPLFDISLGGVGLWLPDTSDAGYEIGTVFSGCQIDLKPLGVLRVDLEIRHHQPVLQRNGKQVLRLGCAFVSLSNATESLVQRFVAQLDRERRSLVG
ncbi:flagellar brake protein [Crenobacter sp. SG2303]|uniref:Flagellar brake protein YcgR n=1 Tax=Crenobacter oryzisoli TaxID=3056844 RepID=A0ABT7XLK4_9NEIS|nr:flagellar brake protein [Crenobacter sp. SG2303]MDN0074666.1 flagellar brake protein [Crenobacter sp. SG2303]